MPLSPNMNLPVPVVGDTLSPTWAFDLNSSLSLIDLHNHADGNGVQIEPSGMNITSDLSFQNHNEVNLRSARFSAQVSPLALGTDLGCLYVSGVDLYYNDISGVQIRITSAGGVAGTPGSIGSLTAPASATYVSATPAFVFQSNVATSANLDGGSVVVRENIANAKGVTLSSPLSLAADYTLTFPAAPPGSQSFMTLSAAGAIATPVVYPLVAAGIANQTITATQIANNTITAAQVANATLTTTQISASAGILGSQLATHPNFVGAAQTGSRWLTQMRTNGSVGTGAAFVRGTVESDTTILIGEGFTVVTGGTGIYDITITNPFVSGGDPVVIASSASDIDMICSVTLVTNTSFRIRTAIEGVLANQRFSFIALGLSSV